MTVPTGMQEYKANRAAAKKRQRILREATARVACDYCGLSLEDLRDEQPSMRREFYARQAQRAAA